MQVACECNRNMQLHAAGPPAPRGRLQGKIDENASSIASINARKEHLVAEKCACRGMRRQRPNSQRKQPKLGSSGQSHVATDLLRGRPTRA